MTVREVVTLYHEEGPNELAWYTLEFLRRVGAGSVLVIVASVVAATFLATTV